MNHQVVIPTDFFLKESKQEYYDYRTRLIQELLQNSLDAGATRINLTLTDAGYSCEDNGKGMSKERMVSALLTMGGSVKDAGATGGFGAAKKLLLFSHDSFRIHSNDTAVDGVGLSYRFTPCSRISGTVVSAVYNADFSGEYVLNRAKALLAKCNFSGRCKVYVNGDLFTNYVGARHAKTVAFGEVYANKNRSVGCNHVLVLHNGIFMFDRYISDLNRKVIVMVNGKSTEVFTQNRDSFKGEVRNQFDSLVAEMAIDKKSIIKPKPRKFVLAGIEAFIGHISRNFFITTDLRNAINAVKAMSVNFTSVQFAQKVAEVVNASGNVDAITQANQIVGFVQNTNAKVATDFHFDLADSSYRKVPDKFLPNVGRPKYTTLAELWKVAVRNVLQANGLDQNFVVGFTFSSEATATYSRKDGIGCYLVNPLSTEINKGTKREKVMKVLTIAVHEVVHSQGHQQHDEDFVRCFHDLLVPTLTNGLTWRQLVKAAKVEKI